VASGSWPTRRCAWPCRKPSTARATRRRSTTTTTPYFRSQGDKLVYDLQGAARLLEEAGWRLGQDGYRAKDGRRLSLVYNLAGKETAGDVLIQDQLRKAGIELKLRVQTKAEWAAANASGNYDLTYTYMTRADPIVLQTILDPRSANSSTLATNAYPPAVLNQAQGLFDTGLTATHSEQRAQAYGDLQALLIDQGSAIPVYERVWQAATAPKVKNFRWSAEGFAFFNDIEIKP
jgi:peptide/nickel transport system substrate-binding protein